MTEQGLEPTAFWDAYIRFAVFRQNVLFNKDWKKVFKLDKKLHRLIKKTSNPEFIEKIFTGDIRQVAYKRARMFGRCDTPDKA